MSQRASKMDLPLLMVSRVAISSFRSWGQTETSF